MSIASYVCELQHTTRPRIDLLWRSSLNLGPPQMAGSFSSCASKGMAAECRCLRLKAIVDDGNVHQVVADGFVFTDVSTVVMQALFHSGAQVVR